MSRDKIIDFEIEREVWNRYELIENAQLKARVVLLRVVERKNPNNQKDVMVGIESRSHFTIIPMKGYKFWGERKNKPYTQSEFKAAKRIEVSFDQVSEDWNVYRLEDGRRLKVKLVITNVTRLQGLTDPSGVPIYDISSTVVFNVSKIK